LSCLSDICWLSTYFPDKLRDLAPQLPLIIDYHSPHLFQLDADSSFKGYRPAPTETHRARRQSGNSGSGNWRGGRRQMSLVPGGEEQPLSLPMPSVMAFAEE